MRSLQVQTWPQFTNREISAHSTALSMSASSITMNGALPPSSRRMAVMLSAARWYSCWPVPTLPVMVTSRVIGFETSSLPIVDPPPVTMFSTPGGNPASIANWPNSSVATGVIERRFDDHRVAGDQRRAELAAGQSDGEVPGGQSHGHAEGHLVNPDVFVRFVGREDVAFHASCALSRES